ncbi:hypothetical protein HYW99_00275 [Candidatus Woesearchaeota archaeon]|nr:hypothetical protein [Candidatus Woesearchaeota archaeon]
MVTGLTKLLHQSFELVGVKLRYIWHPVLNEYGRAITGSYESQLRTRNGEFKLSIESPYHPMVEHPNGLEGLVHDYNADTKISISKIDKRVRVVTMAKFGPLIMPTDIEPSSIPMFDAYFSNGNFQVGFKYKLGLHPTNNNGNNAQSQTLCTYATIKEFIGSVNYYLMPNKRMSLGEVFESSNLPDKLKLSVNELITAKA